MTDEDYYYNKEIDDVDIGFDKFIDDIVVRENQVRENLKRYVEDHGDNHPTRRLNRRIRELPHNRMRFVPLGKTKE